MSSLQEWLIKEDEKAYLSQRSSWTYDTEDVQDELFQLAQHALSYTNELKPVFLFEVKNSHQLKLFDSLMVRDGAVSLLCFFYRWPTPPKGHAKLLIDESLSYLVPASWEELVSYYSLEVHAAPLENFEGIIFTGFVHPEVICLESLESKFRALKEECDLHEKDAYVMTEVFLPREHEHSKQTRPYYVELVGLLKSFFPKLKGLSWDELSTMDVRKMKVYNMDEHKTMCSDSYVNFSLFSRGARPLFEQNIMKKGFGTLELSPFHRLNLREERGPEKRVMSEQLYSELMALKDEVDQDFQKVQELNDRSHLLLGCPRELSSFLFEFLKNQR